MNTQPRRPLRTRSVTDGEDEAKTDLLQETPSSAVSRSGNNEAEANAGGRNHTKPGGMTAHLLGPVRWIPHKARRAFARLRQHE